MIFDENYAYWELMAEKSYMLSDDRLLKKGVSEFENCDAGKNIYVFGCNDAAKVFVNQFREEYQIVGYLDNASGKWGSFIDGIEVFEPEIAIPKMKSDRDAIVIALKFRADDVAADIYEMGFDNLYSLALMIFQTSPYSEFVTELEEYEKAPLEDMILFESTNDFDGNAGALYEYLKKNRTKRSIAWIIKKAENRHWAIDESDEVVCPNENLDELKKFVKLRAIAKWQIWDNNPIRKVRDGQVNVFLQHFGMGYKQTSNYYKTPDYVDYILSPNEFVRKQQQSSLLYPATAEFIYGELPRNDVLKGKWDELAKITGKKFSKVIIWMPTFRQLDTNGRKDADGDFPYGVSLIYTKKQMEQLNDYLKELDMLLIIKPHPRQELNYNCGNYSNIVYISGARNKEIDGYKLMTQMDAMLTDYSSVIFDYMLLDRPVAFVLEDKERFNLEYKMDDPDYFMPGHKIYTMEDMKAFLKSVHDGADPFGDKRRELSTICNPPFEGRGAEKLARRLGLI
ncbi:CDP-glycerol glycerophosphotransferase family protein [Butyrivibrio sp. M55]|uniref:CDP-glycerol glycerophosphotransferase family protein n=1 Tax=Butyrivibrio sp. M55 TaxID=1855323 RepID=UPI0008F12DBD|nr:CDP-glycerol glycerophosphotransferase family protein [Butyrivibrio sp. M55]SFU66029.1 CDP-glycerol glycerophosphotransferase, TagB/SpsB family [Butyrivibrio sp. M55]